MAVRMFRALDEFGLSTACFVNAQPIATAVYIHNPCERNRLVTTLSLDLFYDLDGLSAMVALGRVMTEQGRLPSLYVWEGAYGQAIMLIYFGINNPTPGQVRRVGDFCHDTDQRQTLRYTELFSAAMTEIPNEKVGAFMSQIDVADRYNIRLFEVGVPKSHVVGEFPLTHVILAPPVMPFFNI